VSEATVPHDAGVGHSQKIHKASAAVAPIHTHAQIALRAAVPSKPVNHQLVVQLRQAHVLITPIVLGMISAVVIKDDAMELQNIQVI
jgi:hypothetical protein